MEAFGKIDISHEQDANTGLWCARSDDLAGLFVFARTLPYLRDKLPNACADLVEAIAGQRSVYRWEGNSLVRSG